MEITSLKQIILLQESSASFFLYISAPNCGVCQALRPKVMEMMRNQFPQLQPFYVETHKNPEIAAQLGIYTNPSLVIFLQGKEFIRQSRVISLVQIQEKLKRPYSLVFPSL